MRYVQKVRPFTSTINTVFGTSMHEALQEYLKVMYTQSAAVADKLKLNAFLHERMFENYKLELEKNEGRHFTTLEEINEGDEYGLSIIAWIKKKRNPFSSI